MQSKVDHLMIFDSANSLPLNEILQPWQATFIQTLLRSIIRVPLAKIGCGVGTNFITSWACYQLFCVLDTHHLKPDKHFASICERTEQKV